MLNTVTNENINFFSNMLFDLSKYIDRSRAQSYFDKLMNDKTKINLSKKVKRSLSQNSYLHLLIGYFAIETGYTTVEAKQIYKETSPEIYEYEKDGKKFIRSSAELDTKEMTITIDRFRDYSSKEAGIYLPTPDDRGFLEEIEFELSKNYYV